MICWECYWGWPVDVMAIYTEAIHKLGQTHRKDSEYEKISYFDAVLLLNYGPAHIVWEDHNFYDDSIDYCLEEIANNTAYYLDSHTSEQLEIIRHSLVELYKIKEGKRCACPDDYDGKNPESYPPMFEVIRR